MLLVALVCYAALVRAETSVPKDGAGRGRAAPARALPLPAPAPLGLVGVPMSQPTPSLPLPTKELGKLLEKISDWIMTINLGSNNITHAKSWCPTSIFVNGNLARVLLANYKIHGNTSHRNEGLRWCDSFVGLQIPLKTSLGNQGGYWDTGYKDVFIADTGTAVAALTLCHSLTTDAARLRSYETALKRYTLFVTEGCATAPAKPNVYTKQCPPKGQGWVIPAPHADAGALGDGYYEKEINLTPYTISTATTGSCAFVEYDNIEKQPALEAIAKDAVKWILSKVEADGKIPYILTPTSDNGHTLYQPITYSTESFIDIDLRFPDMHTELATTLKRTVDFMVRNQSADGSWGRWNSTLEEQMGGPVLRFSPSGDAQRSPRALSLLQWYYQRVSPDPAVAKAIRMYATFITTAANQAQYGIGAPTWLTLPTGFVGLAVADLLQPWSTFRPVAAAL